MADKQIHVAVLMGGLSSEREVSLRSGAACATALEGQGYRVSQARCRPRHRRAACRTQARCLLQRSARPLWRGWLHPGRARDACASPTPIPACSPPRLPCTRSAPRRCSPPPAFRSPKACVISRAEAAKAHAMKPPYVIKPPTEGSSVGVYIVREDQAPSAPGADLAPIGRSAKRSWSSAISPAGSSPAPSWAMRRLGVIEIRPGRGSRLLRLRREIRAGRLNSRAAGAA